MAKNVYEGLFLLDSGKSGGNWEHATAMVHGILQRHQAELIASRPWDERRLAFPIKGHKKGMYVLTYFRAEGPNIAKIDGDCRLNEAIVRQLVTKVPPKLVDQLVAQAMAPHDTSSADKRAEEEVEVVEVPEVEE